MRRHTFLLPFALTLVGLIATIPVLSGRHAVESRYRTVELILDFDEIAELAASEGIDVPLMLQKLKDTGVTGIAVSEDTIPKMIESGRAGVLDGAGNLIVEIYGSKEWSQRVQRNLEVKWRAEEIGPRTFAFGEPNFPVTLESLNEVGVGWQPTQIVAVRAAGFTPICRPTDSPRVSERALRFTFQQMEEADVRRVLFTGKFVLGNSDLLPITADELTRRDIAFYAVELDVQDGTAVLTSLLDGHVVRTHSIGDREMLRQTPGMARERFVRAVRERNIRACVIHLFLDRAMSDPLDYNLAYVRDLASDLRENGYVVGDAEPFPSYNPSRPLHLALMVGVAGAAVLLLTLLLPMRLTTVIGLCAAGCIVLVAGGVARPLPARMLSALLATLTFPSIAVLSVWRDPDAARPHIGPLARLLCSYGLFVRASAIALAGGLITASLLSDHLFMTKAQQFRGTKLSQMGPVFIVAVVLALDLVARRETWRDVIARARSRAVALWGHPFTVGYACLAVACLGAAALWIIRTGNDVPAAASSGERQMRSWLEDILVYRPRTKEFMLGHPALILGAFLAASGRRRLIVPCLVIGAIGQASMVNTFCHIHTPILATLLRTIYGIALGLVVAGLTCAAAEVYGRMAGRAAARDGSE